MPFLQFTTSHRAGSHFSKGSGESSKMVPTLAENCFLQARHFHRRRVERKVASAASQRGHFTTPSGQRSRATNARLVSGSEKKVTASSRLAGEAFEASMEEVYQGRRGESRSLLPLVASRSEITCRSSSRSV